MTKRHKNRKKRRKTPAKHARSEPALPAWSKCLIGTVALMTLLGVGFLAHRYLRDLEGPVNSALAPGLPPPITPPQEKPASSTPDPSPEIRNTEASGPVPELSLEQRVLALKDEEMRLAQQMMAEFPQSEEPLVLMGDVLYRRGQTAQATRHWEKALARNPQRADVYERMATLAFDTDGFDQAVTLCQQGLSIDPNRPGVRNLMARSLTRLGRYAEAIVAAQAELKISPRSSLACFLLGRAFWQQRDYEQAERAYLQVIELQPDYTRAYYGLFNVYTRLKQSDKAQRYLAEFKKLDQQDRERVEQRDHVMGDLNFFSLSLAQLCANAHDLYGQAGKGPRTEELLKRAITLQPQNVTYLEKLAFLYGVTKRVPEALSLCRQIIKIDPSNATAYLNIGKFSMWQRRFEPAEDALQKAIACNPEHFGGYQELARLYLRAGKKLDRAQTLAHKAVALRPVAGNYFILGWACDVNGKPQDAMAALTQAIQLDPTQTKYKQAYERIRLREGSK